MSPTSFLNLVFAIKVFVDPSNLSLSLSDHALCFCVSLTDLLTSDLILGRSRSTTKPVQIIVNMWTREVQKKTLILGKGATR